MRRPAASDLGPCRRLVRALLVALVTICSLPSAWASTGGASPDSAAALADEASPAAAPLAGEVTPATARRPAPPVLPGPESLWGHELSDDRPLDRWRERRERHIAFGIAAGSLSGFAFCALFDGCGSMDFGGVSQELPLEVFVEVGWRPALLLQLQAYGRWLPSIRTLAFDSATGFSSDADIAVGSRLEFGLLAELKVPFSWNWEGVVHGGGGLGVLFLSSADDGILAQAQQVCAAVADGGCVTASFRPTAGVVRGGFGVRRYIGDASLLMRFTGAVAMNTVIFDVRPVVAGRPGASRMTLSTEWYGLELAYEF